MSEHTPGPWKWTDSNTGLHLSGSKPGYFATLEGACSGAHGAHGEANARLIAEAPALFELAEAFVSYLQDDSKSPRRRAACLREALEIISQIQEERKP